MINRIKTALICSSLIFVAGAQALPASETAKLYDDYFSQKIKESAVPAAAFAIVSDREILHVGTFGHTDKARKSPVDANTVFRVASVSKTFAPILTGQIVGEGLLDWDDAVSEHSDYFKLKAGTEKVKIRHLLSHSSGLPAYAFDNYIEESLSMQRIYNKFRKLELVCEPGDCYGYQNSAYSLIESVIESTSDKTYAELADERLFTPLQMTTASIGYDAFVSQENRAQPHVLRKGKWKQVRVKPNYYKVPASAGVNASVTDMAKWLIAQMGGAPEVVSPEIVDYVTVPVVKTKRDLRRKHWNSLLTDAHYGLGWRIYQIDDEQIVYHGGWVSGYLANVAYSKKHKVGVVILMNAEARNMNELSSGFWKLFFGLS